MNRIIKIIILVTVVSCSSIPKGNHQMKEMMNDDQDKLAINHPRGEYYQGRPIFVEAAMYPQVVEEGHIFKGGFILINTGREIFSLKEVLTTKDEKKK